MWVAIPISIAFCIAFLYFFNIYWRRRRTTILCEGKIKFYMLPRSGGFPTIKLMPMAVFANIVKVDWIDDAGKKVGLYEFEQADTFNDWWPDNEKRKFQVQVPAVMWREGDPTPLTTTRQYILRDDNDKVVCDGKTGKPVLIVDPPLNAAQALVISNELEITSAVADEDLDTMKKQVNDLYKGQQFMLSKPVVYGSLMIVAMLALASLIVTVTHNITLAPEQAALLNTISDNLKKLMIGNGLVP